MTAMSACTATVNGGPGNGVPSSCSADMQVVGCVGNSTGYSCTGLESPDQGDSALNCSAGTASNGGLTLYCCIDETTVASGCSADSTITGCVGGTIGFSCTGDVNPQTSDSSLVCSTGTASGSATLFCCASYEPPSGNTCAQDPTVMGCTGSSIGFSCSGADNPAVVSPSLTCGAGVPGGAGMQYCCAPTATPTPTPTPTAMCAVDAAVTCAAPSAGYTCTGGVTPMQSDATLSCGAGTAEADGTTQAFCCNTMTTPTPTTGCSADPTVTGCPGDATGYTCTGRRQPDDLVARVRNGHARSEWRRELLLHDVLKTRGNRRPPSKAIYAEGRAL